MPSWEIVMPSTRQKFSVGLFVIIGISLIVFFILLIGLSDYFQDGHRYVGYFRDSVRGLNPSAKVTYKGVHVGLVESINIAPDGELVEVVMLIEKRVADANELVASIRPIGITGIMYVDLERAVAEDLAEMPELTFEPQYPVITTRPSEIARMISGVDEIISSMQQFNVREISEGIETALENLNRIMVDAKIDEISTGLRQTIEKSNTSLDTITVELSRLITESRQTISRVDAILEANGGHLEVFAEDAGKAAKSASVFFDRASGVLVETNRRIEMYDHRLHVIADDLQQAAGSLNRLMEQLSNHPSQLIFGSPVSPKPIDD
jgi:phospholipid/cholesterol/gamma-HCH transport system substrate-binding protein